MSKHFKESDCKSRDHRAQVEPTEQLTIIVNRTLQFIFYSLANQGDIVLQFSPCT